MPGEPGLDYPILSASAPSLFSCEGRRAGNYSNVIKGTVSRNGYFFEGQNILIITVCVCADGFQGLSKAFHCPIQLLTLFCFFDYYLLILKMLTETLLRIPFSVIG